MRKASGFPGLALHIRGFASPAVDEAEPQIKKKSVGKPEAFRKGSGRAATAFPDRLFRVRIIYLSLRGRRAKPLARGY